MSPAKKDSAADEPPFEERLARLEALVDSLEGGELPLEQGVERYGEGVALLQGLQSSLSSAELKVEQLTQVLRRSLEDLERGEDAGDLDPDPR
ncbi:MAG: exodeoxyribonuclease VII small subunit [Planctomycetes bacterium]|nr:exodeoxyribonuclease VII small subunit [Planctomycetota bacterium]MBL7008549.1 exodeoxyribonuclease VII small subunit [Planctomycetota bacterium]